MCVHDRSIICLLETGPVLSTGWVSGGISNPGTVTSSLVLVTGGTGYLGASIIKLLQEEGYPVRTTVRDAGNKKKVGHINSLCPGAKHPVEVVQADLQDSDAWVKAVAGCTYVLHVASPIPNDKVKSEDEIIKPAVDGALNVLKACSLAKTVKRVVFTSSSFAIISGKKPSGESYSESDWSDPDDKKKWVYNRSKGLAEKAVWDYVSALPDSEKFELAVVNPTLILGPVYNEAPGSSVVMAQKMLEHDFPMIPKVCLPSVDVRDAALAHYRCMTVPEAAGHRHLINSDGLWLRQMAEILTKEFKPQGYRICTNNMPNFLLSFVSHFNPQLKAVGEYKTPQTLDNTRMTQVLGITPIPLEKTVIDMGYSLIERGFVDKTPKYKGLPDHIQL